MNACVPDLGVPKGVRQTLERYTAYDSNETPVLQFQKCTIIQMESEKEALN